MHTVAQHSARAPRGCAMPLSGSSTPSIFRAPLMAVKVVAKVCSTNRPRRVHENSILLISVRKCVQLGPYIDITTGLLECEMTVVKSIFGEFYTEHHRSHGVHPGSREQARTIVTPAEPSHCTRSLQLVG